MSAPSAKPRSIWRHPAAWSLLAGLIISSILTWQVIHRAAPLPVYGSLPPMSLTDQAGHPFTLEQVRGRASIVNFIFTSCPSVCPLLTQKMESLQGEISQHSDTVQLLSFSVDPEVDTPEVLRDYAARHHADAKHWNFVTGKPDEVVSAVSDGFKVAVEREKGTAAPDTPSGFALVHGENFVLVDQQARIRGYYKKDPADQERLLADARRLAREGAP